MVIVTCDEGSSALCRRPVGYLVESKLRERLASEDPISDLQTLRLWCRMGCQMGPGLVVGPGVGEQEAVRHLPLGGDAGSALDVD